MMSVVLHVRKDLASDTPLPLDAIRRGVRLGWCRNEWTEKFLSVSVTRDFPNSFTVSHIRVNNGAV
jgi:hypothetical protein